MKPKKSEQRQILSALSLFTQLGVNMVVCMGLGVLLGKFIDSKLDSSPWFLLLYALLGGAAAIRNLYTIVSKRWEDL